MELKNCKLCGGKAEYTDHGHPTWSAIMCENFCNGTCDNCSEGYHGKESSTEKWNAMND
jgi:hypothetical protein